MPIAAENHRRYPTRDAEEKARGENESPGQGPEWLCMTRYSKNGQARTRGSLIAIIIYIGCPELLTDCEYGRDDCRRVVACLTNRESPGSFGHAPQIVLVSRNSSVETDHVRVQKPQC